MQGRGRGGVPCCAAQSAPPRPGVWSDAGRSPLELRTPHPCPCRQPLSPRPSPAQPGPAPPPRADLAAHTVPPCSLGRVSACGPLCPEVGEDVGGGRALHLLPSRAVHPGPAPCGEQTGRGCVSGTSCCPLPCPSGVPGRLLCAFLGATLGAPRDPGSTALGSASLGEARGWDVGLLLGSVGLGGEVRGQRFLPAELLGRRTAGVGALRAQGPRPPGSGVGAPSRPHLVPRVLVAGTTSQHERLQAIAEKRKRQEEIEARRRQLEEDRRQLQHLKSKALRERWLLEGTPPSASAGDEDMRRQMEADQHKAQRLEVSICRLEKEIEALENGDAAPGPPRESSAAPSPARAPAPSPAKEPPEAEVVLNSRQTPLGTPKAEQRLSCTPVRTADGSTMMKAGESAPVPPTCPAAHSPGLCLGPGGHGTGLGSGCDLTWLPPSSPPLPRLATGVPLLPASRRGCTRLPGPCEGRGRACVRTWGRAALLGVRPAQARRPAVPSGSVEGASGCHPSTHSPVTCLRAPTSCRCGGRSPGSCCSGGGAGRQPAGATARAWLALEPGSVGGTAGGPGLVQGGPEAQARASGGPDGAARVVPAGALCWLRSELGPPESVPAGALCWLRSELGPP
uniref:Paralemmin-1 n=1 Tax=Oryctolagus cuniculus TaxID=9986 RepID=G1TUD5_RABIT